MIVNVTYIAQLKQAAGVAAESVDVPPRSSVRALILLVAERHGEALRRLLLDASGAIQSTILLFLNNGQVMVDEDTILKDGDEVTLLSPMAGG
jgi:molybdopterin converting factor small subunit